MRSGADALEKHQIETANAILKSAATPCSRSPQYFAMLGAARSLSGDSGGAEQAFDEAVSLNPRSTQLQTNLGIVCLQNKHVEKGIAALEQSVVLGSSDPRVLFTLGSLLGERGEYRKAVEYLRRIPEPEADDAVNFNLGLAYSHLRQFEKARAAYFRAIDHKPGHAEAYFRVGLDYAAQGEPRNAIPWLFRTRSLGGDRPEVDGVLVEQLLRLKYTKTAEDLVNEALERTPRDLLLIVASGDVLRSKGDYTAANSKYEEALRRNPQLSAALIGLAQTAIATGNDTDAQTYLAKALASDPANLAAKGQLGIVEGSRGDWESAVGHLRSAWEADQSNDEIGLELARALRHRGQVSQALEILKRLDSRMSEVAPFHLELANLYAAMHRPADAETERAIVANLESRAHQDLRFQESQTYVF